jgi:hypothetical protein
MRKVFCCSWGATVAENFVERKLVAFLISTDHGPACDWEVVPTEFPRSGLVHQGLTPTFR